MTKQTNKKLVCGMGTNDLDEPAYINGKQLKFYNVWKSMICRCYSEKCQARFPTYRDCSVCNDWLLLSKFKEWFDANYRTGMSLDKDILIQGNKVYSPDTCRFVPEYINSLLTDAGAIRGNLPCGVVAVKSTSKTGEINTAYRARCRDGKGGRPAKEFRSVDEAAAWYSIEKKKVVKDIVLDAFWRNEIMSDVATALLEREW